VANKGWGGMKDSLEEWNKARIEKVVGQVKKDMTQLRANIIKELRAGDQGKTPNSSALSDKTRVSAEAKSELLSPGGQKKDVKDPLSGLDLYIDSIIIEEDGSGVETVQTVKLINTQKKDETTGMALGKIAKAIEFGTTRSAPRPAWRRSLKKLEATGVYKKKTT
jgi:hypothetical protein